jgi:hypothetical protein
VENDVCASCEPRGAVRPAVDLGRSHAVDECVRGVGVAVYERCPAAFGSGVVLHGSFSLCVVTPAQVRWFKMCARCRKV